MPMLDRTTSDTAPSPSQDDVVHDAVADAPKLPARRKRSLWRPLMVGGVLVVFVAASYV